MLLYIGGFGFLRVRQVVTFPHSTNVTVRNVAVNGDIATRFLYLDDLAIDTKLGPPALRSRMREYILFSPTKNGKVMSWPCSFSLENRSEDLTCGGVNGVEGSPRSRHDQSGHERDYRSRL